MAEIQKNQKTQADTSARFVEFVMMHTQNIMFLLGQIPSPDGKAMKPNFEAARLFIDQFEMIEEKTRGNLTTEEKQILTNALSNVRLAFVETVNASGKAPNSTTQETESNSSKEESIVTPSTGSGDDDEKDDHKRFSKSYG